MPKKVVPVLIVLALATLGLAAAAFARPLTTGPDHVDTVKVTMRDSGISLSKATFLRGGNARFVATNKGSRPYRFKLGVVATKLLAPGKTDVILAELDYRGTFPLRQLNAAGKVVGSVNIKIT